MTGVSSLSGCAVTDLPHCVSRAAMLGADTKTLNVILGMPAQHVAESPFVTISRSGDLAAGNALELKLVDAPAPWPADFDETRCKGLDWRTYRVEVDQETWNQFWTPADPPQISLGLGLAESTVAIPRNKFAFALVSGDTSKPLISMGCYWT